MANHDDQPAIARGPIRLNPHLDPKPWGGQGLRHIGFVFPDDAVIGEAHLTAPGAVVADGPLAGQTLGEIVLADPEGTIGALGLRATAGAPVFPLLIKLIDAHDVLSVQVHPDDEEARALGSPGKTEAWHVLSAGIESELYLGLHTPSDLDELAIRARSGARTSSFLRAIPARPMETVLIPAGTIHALGAGIMVYEIQQPSGITYRLDDWGRMGSDGKSRELHIDESLAVAKPAYQPEPIAPIEIEQGRTLLTACRYFALEKLSLTPDQTVTIDHPGSPAVLTLLDGNGIVSAAGKRIDIRPGETVVIFPRDMPATLHATPTTLTALHGWVPDLTAEIVHPALAAGASNARIAALAGPLNDLL